MTDPLCQGKPLVLAYLLLIQFVHPASQLCFLSEVWAAEERLQSERHGAQLLRCLLLHGCACTSLRAPCRAGGQQPQVPLKGMLTCSC